MIATIEGKLLQLDTAGALVQVGGLGYEIFLPSYCVSALSNKIGQTIQLCTMEYLEGSMGGGNMIPRIIGFLSPAERDFFRTYTSVKGMGIKKGLKSLTIPITDIALAIEEGDDKTLLSLPAVGKRMSQQIIAELKGKLQSYAAQSGASLEGSRELEPFQIEALEVMIAWGEKREETIELIKKASEKHSDIKTAEQLVPLVYKLKQGVEV
jgi:Holliday junction DNA helicase RuvA